MNLPNIFQNKNIKVLNNQQNLYYGKDVDTTPVKSPYKDIRNDIKRLFSSKNYVYRLNCIITCNDRTIDTYIIGHNSNSIITIDNELIPIKDIIDIKEKGKV